MDIIVTVDDEVLDILVQGVIRDSLNILYDEYLNLVNREDELQEFQAIDLSDCIQYIKALKKTYMYYTSPDERDFLKKFEL